MKIYRNQDDGNLYIIFHVKPPKYSAFMGQTSAKKSKKVTLGKNFNLFPRSTETFSTWLLD